MCNSTNRKQVELFALQKTIPSNHMEQRLNTNLRRWDFNRNAAISQYNHRANLNLKNYIELHSCETDFSSSITRCSMPTSIEGDLKL